MTKLVIEFGKH